MAKKEKRKKKKMVDKIKNWCIKRLGGYTQEEYRKNYWIGKNDAYNICLEHAEENLYGLTGDEWADKMYKFLKLMISK